LKITDISFHKTQGSADGKTMFIPNVTFLGHSHSAVPLPHSIRFLTSRHIYPNGLLEKINWGINRSGGDNKAESQQAGRVRCLDLMANWLCYWEDIESFWP